MKIIFDNEKVILYLNKFMTKDLDFKDMNNLELYFKNLFIKLREIYNIKINGFYYVYVFIDNLYGIVLELEKEDLDFFDYDENDVDMHIVLQNVNFLYEIEDIFDRYGLYEYLDIYFYKDKYYGKIKSNIDNTLYMNLIEISNLIYKGTNEVLKYGKKIET